MAIYSDSMMTMIDPNCAVHQPEQPKDWYDMQSVVDDRAEKAALKTADMSSREFGQTGDDVRWILMDHAAGSVSASEKAAVNAKSAELKDLMGMNPPAPTPAAAVAAPAAAPAVAQGPVMPAGVTMPSDCEIKNLENHQAEVDALGARGWRRQGRGNNALMMAIADTINRIQTAGCTEPAVVG